MQVHVIGTLAVPATGAVVGEVLTYTAGGPSWEPPTGGGGSLDPEAARDTIAAALVEGTGIDITVDDTANTITVSVSGLTKSSVGLGNVDNTADVDKPLSTAMTSALGDKAGLSDLAAKANDADVVHDTGNETVGGVKTFTSAPVVPDNSFSIAKVSGLTTRLPILLTQTAYNALTPVAGQLYIITGA